MSIIVIAMRSPVAESGQREEVRRMARDPVCCMEVDEKKAAATSAYQGKAYFFCTPACKAMFLKDPDKYVGAERFARRERA